MRWGFAVLVIVSACAVSCAEQCPSPASECPDGCRTVDGIAYDDALTCWQLEETTLGCLEDDIVEAVETCVIRDSDGALFRISGITIPAGYERGECDSQATFCADPSP